MEIFKFRTNQVFYLFLGDCHVFRTAFLLPGVFVLAALAACKPQDNSAAQAASSSASALTAENAAKPQTRGTDMRKEDIGGDFTLTDGEGKPFSLSDLKGKVVILSFGFTHCPDVCPTELLTYSDTLKQLGGQAKDVKVVFVSIDPERDTPEIIGKYAKQFNPDFIGLTATGGQNLPVIKQQYRVVSAKINQKTTAKTIWSTTLPVRISSTKTVRLPFSRLTEASRKRLLPM